MGFRDETLGSGLSLSQSSSGLLSMYSLFSEMMVSFFRSLIASACGNFCVYACLSVCFCVGEGDIHLNTYLGEVSVLPIVYAVISSQLAAVFNFYL